MTTTSIGGGNAAPYIAPIRNPATTGKRDSAAPQPDPQPNRPPAATVETTTVQPGAQAVVGVATQTKQADGSATVAPSVATGPGTPASGTSAKPGTASAPLQAYARANAQKTGEEAGYTSATADPEGDEVESAAARHIEQNDAAIERAAEKAEKERLDAAVKHMNDLAGAMYRNVSYRLNPDSQHVEIVDASTDRVIRTLPPESMLDRMSRLYSMLGLIFDELG